MPYTCRYPQNKGADISIAERLGNIDKQDSCCCPKYHFLTSQNEGRPKDVTLLLHVTLDRLIPMLEPLGGAMSIAVFANDSEVSDLLLLILSSPIIRSRQNIGYPINPLRDVALENVRTTYVFLNDMDFLPSFRLYLYLKQTVSKFDFFLRL